MQSKMKRTTRKTVDAATTDGVPSKPTGTRNASRIRNPALNLLALGREIRATFNSVFWRAAPRFY